MLNLKIKYNNFLTFFSILAFCINVPFIFWYLFGSFYAVVSALIIVLLFIFTLHFYFLNNIKLDKNDVVWLSTWAVFLLSFALYSFLLLLLNSDLLEFRKFIGLFIKILFLFSITIIIKTNLQFYIKQIFRLNILIILLSVILFFLLAFGSDIPNFVFTKFDHRPHWVYWIGATNAVLSMGGHTLIRIAGFSDEPGAFALIITYLIVMNELTYRSSKIRIILLIGGLFTFSLAFFLTLFIFMLYWYSKGLINIKVIIFSIMVCGLFFWIGQLKNMKPITKMVSIFSERFEKDRSGRFKGDNRSQSFDVQIKAFVEKPIFGIGIDPDELKRIDAGSNSIFVYLAMHGIWGIFFNFLPFYLLLVLNLKRKELLLLIAILINYFQRPGIEDTFSMMSLTVIFYASIKMTDEGLNQDVICPGKIVTK